MKGKYRYILLEDRVMKIRKLGNIGSYTVCRGKRKGAYFIGNDGVFLLMFPDNNNMIYELNDIMGFMGKVLDRMMIKLWCYAYYEEFNISM